MIHRILGFDISSSCVGYCLLLLNDETSNITLDTLNHFKPTKKGSVLERLQNTRDHLADIINQLQPTDIAIEDIIVFMPRRSSANTIIILALFNRMTGLLSLDYLGKPPSLYSVGHIRRGLQCTEEEKQPEKEMMPELVASHLNIKFPWLLNKRSGKKVVENYDRADSIAAALFHAYILSGKCKPPPPPKKKTRKPKKSKPIKRQRKNSKKKR